MGFTYAAGDISLYNCFILFSSLSCFYLIFLAVYRLFFHPLARFPGPFWARISGFPAYLHTLRGDRHVWCWLLQQKYGSSFRIAPNSVLINTPTGLKEIFNNQANVTKSTYYKAYPRTVDTVNTWNSVDKSVHARKRRVLAHAFSENSMRSVEQFIHSNVDRWCELIGLEIAKGEWSNPLNMADWANHLIFDILGDLCFGKSFDMKEAESELRHVPHLLTSFLEMLHPIAYSPFAPLWVWLKPRGLNALMAKAAPPAVKNWEKFVEDCFMKRAKAEEDIKKSMSSEKETRKDFFHYLFKAKDPESGSGYTLAELYGETETLIIAGSDTTSISLAAGVFYLVRFPEVQKKLANELRSCFSDLDSIKGGTVLSSCQYLRAFIDETLRLSPPVPADLEREVCQGGAVIDGHHVPQGIQVSSSHYCIHLNEDYYEDPLVFRPERWIRGEGDAATSPQDVAQAQGAFCAFSVGPHGCIGKNLAYLEMSITFAKLIYQFEIIQEASNNLGGGSPDAMPGRQMVDQYQLRDIFVATRDGPIVKFKKRE